VWYVVRLPSVLSGPSISRISFRRGCGRRGRGSV